MKIAMFMLIAAAIVGYGIYYVGGAASFDPGKQGRDHQAQIKPGMTWTQVLTIAPEPHSLITFSPDPKTKELRPAPSAFDRKLIENGVKAGDFKLGFGFSYRYTMNVMFDVLFDATGKVEAVSETTGINKLFK